MTATQDQIEDIKALEKQKQALIDEIDQLEKKLVSVKGKITLQCGTEIMIEPQFHLKLDPKQRIRWAAIYAIIDNVDRGIQRFETRISHPRGSISEVYGTEGPCQTIKLWERWDTGLD